MKTDLASCRGSALKGFLKLGGFFLLVIVFVPVHLALRVTRHRIRPTTLPCFFHKTLSSLVGFKIRVRGEMALREGAPTFFVSNHTSYLDIPVLGGIIPGYFIAKSDVASWPFIGMMARLQNTVFVERKTARARKQSHVLRERLEAGHNLILFPEGTSTDGQRTLPFKSSLFSVVETPLPSGAYALIQPVSIVATEVGGLPMGRAWRPYYAWYGDMTFVKHVWEFFKIGSFTVDVIFHPPVTIEDFGNRKLLSDYCQCSVSKGVNQCLTGRFEKECVEKTG